MNILLVTDANLERGGITIFMLQWVYGIRNTYTNSNICVYFRDHIEDKELEKRFKDEGVKIYIGNIPRKVKFGVPKARNKVRDDISKIIENESIDVIHVNSGVFGFNLDLLSLAEKMGVKIRISHSHGAYPERKRDKFVHFFVRQGINYYATAYAACSKNAGKYLFGQKGIKSRKWHFIPNSIDVRKFAFNEEKRVDSRNSLNLADSELLLGAVGHLCQGKNHIFLLDVLHDLLARDVKAKLIILGKGDMENRLRERGKELGIENELILYGPSDDVPRWLSAMDIYLMPSASEGLGISAVEAQANGLPCLLSDRFPEEVVMTENVWCLPIDKGTDEWVDVLTHLSKRPMINRELGAQSVIDAGFDVAQISKHIRALYK